MIEQLFYSSSALIITIIIVNFFINNIVNKGSVFCRWQNIYLLFILFHSVYIHAIRLFFNGNYYLDVGAPFSLFYGPFYYAALYSIVPVDSFDIKNIIAHFYLGLIFSVLFILIALLFKENIDVQVWFCRILYTISSLQIIIYAILSYVKYNQYAAESFSTSIMSQSLTLFIAVSLIFSSLIFVNPEAITNYLNSFIVHMIMLLGVWILFQYNLINMKRIIVGRSNIRQIIERKTVEEATNKNELTTEEDIERNQEKYQKSKITEVEIQSYMKIVQIAFDKKIYLDTELNLEKLSKEIKIPKYHLTQVFTFGFEIGFNKLVNQYRIEYAVKLLEDSTSNMTIEEIGMESGFNSRSSFYRAFNIYYDVSPAQYKDNYQK